MVEEWPGFTAWANRYASDRFTRQEYALIHLGGIAMAMLLAGLMSRFANRGMTFLAVCVYPLVVWVVTRSAVREGLLRPASFAAALVIAGAFHLWEVGASRGPLHARRSL